MKFRSAVFAVVAVLLMGGTAPALEGMSKQEFLAQYEPAAERLQRFYEHITLEAVVTRSNLEHKNSRIARQRLVLRTDGDKMRIDGFVPDGTGGESVRVAVTSPGSSFTLRRQADQESFVLSHLSSDSTQDMRSLRSRHYYLFAPFCESAGVILADKIRPRNFRIISIEEEERNGEQLVKVAYERDVHFKGKPLTYAGYDVFSKTMGWALREFARGRQRGIIEYDGMIDGVPLLKTAEYWRQKGDERVNILRCEVTKIEPYAAPPDTFEFAALVGDVRQEGKSSYWLLLIAGGVVLIAIAVVLARFAAHRRAAA